MIYIIHTYLFLSRMVLLLAPMNPKLMMMKKKTMMKQTRRPNCNKQPFNSNIKTRRIHTTIKLEKSAI